MPKKLTCLRRSFSGKRSVKTFIVKLKENERQVEVREKDQTLAKLLVSLIYFFVLLASFSSLPEFNGFFSRGRKKKAPSQFGISLDT